MVNLYKLSRIRKGKTNYRKRERLLMGKTDFVSVKVSTQNIFAQVLRPQFEGDKVLTSVHSRELNSYGWKGSLKNMSACYLVGYLLGRKCDKIGVNHVVLYTGTRPFTARISSCVKGLIEAGVTSPHSVEILPPDERIRGEHIASYASLMRENEDKYRTRFSGLLAKGMNPETYPDHFDSVKNQIMQAPFEELAMNSRRPKQP
jgi:large subunit ribosomal protein L18